MKTALGNRRQLVLWGFLAVVLVLALVRMQKGPNVSPTPAATRSGRATPVPGDEERTASSRPRGGREEKKVSPDEVPIFTTRDLDSAGSRQAPSGPISGFRRFPLLPRPHRRLRLRQCVATRF